MVTLIQLEYIVAVDTYRHFATAAEKSFVTQPTLSMQIKKMEDQLGVIIFDRSKQPVTPTDIGKTIIAQARETLREYSKLDEIIQSHQNIISGELKIGVIPTIAPYLLPKFLGSFSRKYKDLHVHVKEMVTSDIIKNLLNDQIDVGILVTPLQNESLKTTPLYYEEIKVYANKKHEFIKKDTISAQEIASPDLWLLSEGHCFRSQVLNLCAYHTNRQEKNAFEFESGSLETLKKMVDIEGGYTLLPELAIADLPLEKSIQAKPFTNLKPVREISICYVRTFAKQRLLQILTDHIKEQLPPHMLSKEAVNIVDWS